MNQFTVIIQRLITLGRFQFLIGGFLLYTVGALLAVISTGDFPVFYYLFGYLIMLPAHLSLSYSNNYYDIEVDKYNTPTFIAGGSKILINYPELKKITIILSILLIALSLTLAVIFIILAQASWLFFIFILSGNLLGLFYTAPPLKLSYRGLGEVVNVVSIGLLMPGMGYWTMKGSLDLFFLVFALPMFLYGLEFILLLEIPDMMGDKIGGKNTFIVKKGRSFGFSVVIVCLIFATLYYGVISFVGLYQGLLDYRVVFFISFIPLFAALQAWRHTRYTSVNWPKIAAKTFNSLYVLIVLILMYFLVLILFF
jgi:1,4-dihydroxy-2-naphthoate octaprenyltransferase